MVYPYLCKYILECLETALPYNSEIKFIFLYELEVIPAAKTSFTVFYIRHRAVWVASKLWVKRTASVL